MNVLHSQQPPLSEAIRTFGRNRPHAYRIMVAVSFGRANYQMLWFDLTEGPMVVETPSKVIGLGQREHGPGHYRDQGDAAYLPAGVEGQSTEDDLHRRLWKAVQHEVVELRG